jgi:hypothetical protein
MGLPQEVHRPEVAMSCEVDQKEDPSVVEVE